MPSVLRRGRHRRGSLAATADIPVTPCRSTNRRPCAGPQIRRSDRAAGPLWSAATGATAAADDEREEDDELGELPVAETDLETGAPSVASYSCDAETLLHRMGARKWGTSSHGSCAAWSVTSLMEKRPASPSPMCSPHLGSPSAVSSGSGGMRRARGGLRVCKSPEPTHSDDVFYSQVSTDLHSSAPRFQSSGSMAARRSTSRLEIGGKRRSNARASMNRKSFCPASSRSPLYVKPGRRSGFNGILELEKDGNCRTRRSVTLAGGRFSTGSRLSPLRNSTSGDHKKCCQLSVLGEEDEEQEERGWRKRNQLILAGAPLVRRKSHRRCHAYSPSADCTADSGLGSGDGDITCVAWDDGRVDAELPRISPTVQQGGRGKLLEWRETRTRKVLDKLKKKEAEISDWEARETSKAKNEMKKIEEKLEKKRSKAMETMQLKVVEARRKAEKKKSQARQAAVKKMSKVEKACDKLGSMGRLPWKPQFLF